MEVKFLYEEEFALLQTEGFKMCTPLQNTAVNSTEDVLIFKEIVNGSNKYTIVTRDLRGGVISLGFTGKEIEDFTHILQYKEDFTQFSHALEPLEKIRKYPNTLSVNRDSEDNLKVDPTSLILNYEDLIWYFENDEDIYSIGSYYLQPCKNALIFISEQQKANKQELLFMLDFYSLVNAVINIQIYYGYEEIEMKALTFGLPDNLLLKPYHQDNILYLIGNSVIFYQNKRLEVVQRDVYDIATSEEFFEAGDRLSVVLEMLNSTPDELDKLVKVNLTNYNVKDDNDNSEIYSQFYLVKNIQTDDASYNKVVLMIRYGGFVFEGFVPSEEVFNSGNMFERKAVLSDFKERETVIIPLEEIGKLTCILNDKLLTAEEVKEYSSLEKLTK